MKKTSCSSSEKSELTKSELTKSELNKADALGKSDVLVIPASSSLDKEELISRVSKLEGVQVFDMDAIVHEDHVRFAFFHALKVFEEGKNITRSLGLELLLRAAASRQITAAIDTVGVKDPKNIVIGALADKFSEDDLLKRLEAKRKDWKQKGEKELEAVIRKMVGIQLES